MASDPKERKRTLLKFLLAKQQEQPRLFRQIINNDLIRTKEYMEGASEETILINEHIYNSKLKEIKIQTDILKDQIEAHAKGIKHSSIISIIDRKLYIIEMQLDVGVYNLLNNKNVKFYFDT